MKRVIIVHRWGATPKDDWYPWLKSELEKSGYEVMVPEMPDTENPVIEKWVKALAEIVGAPDADTYFVGHSIGCQAIMRYLETVKTPVGGAIFVAGWFNLENLEDDETRATAKPWIETPVGAEKVKQVLPQSILYISDDDPYKCLEENEEKFGMIVTEISVMPHAGHFTAEDGWKEIPQVPRKLDEFRKR